MAALIREETAVKPGDESLIALSSLAHRKAIVTGAARGIGRAISDRFVEAGAEVVYGDIDFAAAREAAAEASSRLGGKAVAGEVDVSDEQSIREFVAESTSRLGGLDLLVNNAGIFPVQSLLTMSSDQWDKVHDINLRGAFVASREAVRQMLESGSRHSAIINVASVGGIRGHAGLAHYIASKHGMVGLTRSMAIELGPLGIRVVALAPTVILTEGQMARSRSLPEEERLRIEREQSSLEKQVPLQRLGTPDDVARVALFAAGELAAFVTGCVIPVDGGRTAA